MPSTPNNSDVDKILEDDMSMVDGGSEMAAQGELATGHPYKRACSGTGSAWSIALVISVQITADVDAERRIVMKFVNAQGSGRR